MRGVVGVSGDGSYVYFVAKGVLSRNVGNLDRSGEGWKSLRLGLFVSPLLGSGDRYELAGG